MKKYEVLRKHYPEYVSLDQLSRICKIAKRSASYLITQGIIPSIDTGKKTWRYKIALDDVIVYLRKREQVGSMIPRGVISSRNGARTRNPGNHKTFALILEQEQTSELAEYFNFVFSDFDDVLTAEDISEMTGLNRSTVLKLLKAGHIKSIMVHPRYMIPKQYLLDFVITRKFLKYRTDSEQFYKILGGFELWKIAKSSR